MPPPRLDEFIASLPRWLAPHAGTTPWAAATATGSIVEASRDTLGGDFLRRDGFAVHRQADVHPSAVLSGVGMIDAGATIGPHSHLRGGVIVGVGAVIGSSCEVKSTWLLAGSRLAHLNYVGDSVIGTDVNLEAGAVIANHLNEQPEDEIRVLIDGDAAPIGQAKFGAAIGDGSRIGANAVTTPGTLLAPGSIVARLELVDQVGTR